MRQKRYNTLLILFFKLIHVTASPGNSYSVQLAQAQQQALALNSLPSADYYNSTFSSDNYNSAESTDGSSNVSSDRSRGVVYRNTQDNYLIDRQKQLDQQAQAMAILKEATMTNNSSDGGQGGTWNNDAMFTQMYKPQPLTPPLDQPWQNGSSGQSSNINYNSPGSYDGGQPLPPANPNSNIVPSSNYGQNYQPQQQPPTPNQPMLPPSVIQNNTSIQPSWLSGRVERRPMREWICRACPGSNRCASLQAQDPLQAQAQLNHNKTATATVTATTLTTTVTAIATSTVSLSLEDASQLTRNNLSAGYSVNQAEAYSGIASYFSAPNGLVAVGACGLQMPSDGLVAALSGPFFTQRNCGRCLAVQREDGVGPTIRVKAWDRCKTCQGKGDLDLSERAWSLLSSQQGDGGGRMPIRWSFTPC